MPNSILFSKRITCPAAYGGTVDLLTEEIFLNEYKLLKLTHCASTDAYLKYHLRNIILVKIPDDFFK